MPMMDRQKKNELPHLEVMYKSTEKEQITAPRGNVMIERKRMNYHT
jgi:hypothetical protein